MAYWQYKGDHSCEDEFLRLYITVYSLLLEKTCDTDQSADIFRRMLILFEQVNFQYCTVNLEIFC